MIITYYDQTLI